MWDLLAARRISSALCKPLSGFPADPITLRHEHRNQSQRGADRPDQGRTRQSLYYQGKKEQLAFGEPDGRSATSAITFAFG